MFPDNAPREDRSYEIGEIKTRLVFFLGLGSIVFMIFFGSGLFFALATLGIAFNIKVRHPEVLLVEKNYVSYKRGILFAKISLIIFAFFLFYQIATSMLSTGIV